MATPMEMLDRSATDRNQVVEKVKLLAPWASGPVSPVVGSASVAQQLLGRIDPKAYSRNRNYGDGNVSALSPFIHHGMLPLNVVRDHALATSQSSDDAYKFIQELAWREFWQRCAWQHPGWLWNDVEPYKTGFKAEEYRDELTDDILGAATGVACLDAFIQQLITTGYLHNHARMYLASFLVHFRRIKWQAGARWFLVHLLDGDEASNNLSWQWVASTFSHKPYIFNLDNVNKYFAGQVDTFAENNAEIDYSYIELTAKLFRNEGNADG